MKQSCGRLVHYCALLNLPIIGLCLMLPPVARAEGGGPGVVLLETSDTGLRLRVAPVPCRGEEGQIVLVGIPPGAEVSARLLFEDGGKALPLQVEVVLTGRLRDQTFAAVRLRHTGDEDDEHIEAAPPYADVQIVFEPQPRMQPRMNSTAIRPEHPLWEPVLACALVNYEQARVWRQKPGFFRKPRFLGSDGPWYKVTVSADGLYRLTHADLAAAGLPMDTLDPATLCLLDDGVEIPLWEEDDTLYFYGQQRRSRYGDENVYWLTYGGVARTRMLTRSVPYSGNPAAPTYTVTARFEEDELYRSQLPMLEETDHWYWENYQNSLSAYLAIYPPGLASGDYTATLRIALQGYTSYPSINPDHHARVLLNGHTLGNVTWDGQEPAEATFDFPSGWLMAAHRPGGAGAGQDCDPSPPAHGGALSENLEVQVVPDTGAMTDAALVNWLELTYQRTPTATADSLTVPHAGAATHDLTNFTADPVFLLDIADATSPTLLTNAHHTSPLTFDVSRLTPHVSRFTPHVQFTDPSPASHVYLAAGPTAVRIPTITQDVPSDWRTPGHGADYIAIAPASLHDSLQPLLTHREGQGLRVALVDLQDVYDEFGDGELSAEPIRDFLAYAYASWQPPAPSYVLLVGDGHYDFQDNLSTGSANPLPPYLALADPWLGETAADIRFVTVSGDDPLPDLALGRLPVNTPAELSGVVNKILAYEGETGFFPKNPVSNALFVADDADGPDDFAAYSDLVADHLLPDGITAHKVYLGETHLTPESVREAIVAAINDGVLLVNYVGHGWINYWADEELFGLGELAQLDNGGHYPVFLPMTCWEGYYHMPDYPSLAESLVRAPGKGAVASWSPTGQGVVTGHDVLHQAWYSAVFSDGITHLGLANVAAQVALYQQAPEHVALIDTYVLLGDPATHLAYWPEQVYLPVVSRIGINE